MDKLTIDLVNARKESKELDHLLWEVLWKPIGLPRDVRDSFKLKGDCLEIVAVASGRVVERRKWENGDSAHFR